MNSRTHPVRVAASERRAQAVALRISGMTYDAIAQRLGVGSTTVFRDVTESMADAAKRTREAADELLELELQRLDTLQGGLWDAALAGDVSSVRAVLAVMERRAKLLGLDAAAKPGDAPPTYVVELQQFGALPEPGAVVPITRDRQ